MRFEDVDALEAALAGESYLADRGLAVARLPGRSRSAGRCCWRASRASGRPRSPGRSRACSDAELIRLQCYEGIDAGQALYEWDYSRQLLYARTIQDGELDPSQPRGRAVRPGVPGRAPAAARGARGRRGGAAGRRARPGRRGVRGVPARGAGRLRGDDPGDRHGHGRGAAGRGAHLQPHARAARRAQAPLPLPLDRLPERGARGGDHPPAGARGVGGARPLGGRGGGAAARDGPGQAARRRRRRSTGRGALAALGVGAVDAAAADETLGWVVKNRDDLAMVRRALPELLEA